MLEQKSPETRTSSLAVTSLIFSLLSLLIGPLGFIPGIMMGHVALSQIKQNPEIQGKGLAKAGLVIGYLVLAVAVVMLVGFYFTAIKDPPPDVVILPQ